MYIALYMVLTRYGYRQCAYFMGGTEIAGVDNAGVDNNGVLDSELQL